MNALTQRVETAPGLQAFYRSFEFDREKMLFLIDGQEVQISEFADDSYGEIGVAETDFENTPLILSLGWNLTGTKALDDWIKAKKYDPKQVQAQVLKIMREVFDQQFILERGESFFDEEELQDMPQEIDDGPDFTNFRFGFREDEFAGLNFQVAGNCACLSNDFSGSSGRFIPEKDDCTSYDLHNIDSGFQRVAIYAGIGHIARLASGRPFAQMTIDEIGVSA